MAPLYKMPSPYRVRAELGGQRFGILTALEYLGYRVKGGNGYWRCRCDCGTEKDIRADRLTRGLVFSCGCQSTHRINKQPQGEQPQGDKPQAQPEGVNVSLGPLMTAGDTTNA